MATTDETTAPVVGEHRMLIDGKLVEASSGKQFDNINPATEEVLGQVADAGSEDMDAAIAAGRRAFDESGWADDKEMRKRCIRQLHAALEEEKELLRAELVAEVGSPVLLTYGPQLDAPCRRGSPGRPASSTTSSGSVTSPTATPSGPTAGARWPRNRSGWWPPSCRGTTRSR